MVDAAALLSVQHALIAATAVMSVGMCGVAVFYLIIQSFTGR